MKKIVCYLFLLVFSFYVESAFAQSGNQQTSLEVKRLLNSVQNRISDSRDMILADDYARSKKNAVAAHGDLERLKEIFRDHERNQKSQSKPKKDQQKNNDKDSKKDQQQKGGDSKKDSKENKSQNKKQPDENSANKSSEQKSEAGKEGKQQRKGQQGNQTKAGDHQNLSAGQKRKMNSKQALKELMRLQQKYEHERKAREKKYGVIREGRVNVEKDW